MHHTTAPKREHAGDQQRKSVAQHHPDLVLANIALTSVINGHYQLEQGPVAEQMNRAERTTEPQFTDKNDEMAT